MAKYSFDCKKKIVQTYLDGKGSSGILTKKYGIILMNRLEYIIMKYKGSILLLDRNFSAPFCVKMSVYFLEFVFLFIEKGWFGVIDPIGYMINGQRIEGFQSHIYVQKCSGSSKSTVTSILSASFIAVEDSLDCRQSNSFWRWLSILSFTCAYQMV